MDNIQRAIADSVKLNTGIRLVAIVAERRTGERRLCRFRSARGAHYYVVTWGEGSSMRLGAVLRVRRRGARTTVGINGEAGTNTEQIEWWGESGPHVFASRRTHSSPNIHHQKGENNDIATNRRRRPGDVRV